MVGSFSFLHFFFGLIASLGFFLAEKKKKKKCMSMFTTVSVRILLCCITFELIKTRRILMLIKKYSIAIYAIYMLNVICYYNIYIYIYLIQSDV